MKITWLPEDMTQTTSRLGLTHIPGGEAQSAAVDLDALADAGVKHVVCLVEAEELAWMDPPEDLSQRRSAVERRGMSFLHLPIVDYETPSLEDAWLLIQRLAGLLDAPSQDAVLHCWAGLGRAGTMAACFLVSRGMPAGQAITMIRFFRPGAIQSLEQELLIEQFAAAQGRL